MAKKKRLSYNPYATATLVVDRWPFIQKIVVDYHAVHPWSSRPNEDKGTISFTADDQAVFLLKCPTNDCTIGHLDITRDISSMVANKETCCHFEKLCPGREAKDHPEQSCMTMFTYTISITYCG